MMIGPGERDARVPEVEEDVRRWRGRENKFGIEEEMDGEEEVDEEEGLVRSVVERLSLVRWVRSSSL